MPVHVRDRSMLQGCRAGCGVTVRWLKPLLLGVLRVTVKQPGLYRPLERGGEGWNIQPSNSAPLPVCVSGGGGGGLRERERERTRVNN